MKLSIDVNDLSLHYFSNIKAEDITTRLLSKYHSGISVWNRKLLIGVVTFPSSKTLVMTWVNDSSKVSAMDDDTKEALRVSIRTKLGDSLFFYHLAFNHQQINLGKVFYLTSRLNPNQLSKRSGRGLIKTRLTVFSLLPEWTAAGKTVKEISNGLQLLGVNVGKATVSKILRDMYVLKAVTRSKASDGVAWLYFKEPTVTATRFLSMYSSVI